MLRIIAFGNIVALVLLFVSSGVQGAQYAEPAPPDQPSWAYAVAATPSADAAPLPSVATILEDDTVWRLPGAGQTFTGSQIRDRFGPADWFPGDHPPVPNVVSHGRRPVVQACAFCHYHNGKGRPENAGVAGLPVGYFIQTMNDFRNDLRQTAEPRKTNTATMSAIAKAMTDDEIKAAADYFGSMQWTKWIRVVETDVVQKTRLQFGIHWPLDEAGTEPIGQRIIESPEAFEHAANQRNPRSGWIAYVPTGAIGKGEDLVTQGGNGRTIACGTCHGADLMGTSVAPGIAGRSPNYLVRQMYDMKMGTRRGPLSGLMNPVVENLSNEDFVNIAAYAASRPVEEAVTR